MSYCDLPPPQPDIDVIVSIFLCNTPGHTCEHITHIYGITSEIPTDQERTQDGQTAIQATRNRML